MIRQLVHLCALLPAAGFLSLSWVVRLPLLLAAFFWAAASALSALMERLLSSVENDKAFDIAHAQVFWKLRITFFWKHGQLRCRSFVCGCLLLVVILSC